VPQLLPSQTTPKRSKSDRHKGRWARMDDRDKPGPDHIVSFGPFRLFAAERLLKKGDEPVPLGGRALDILIALVERAGEVITRRELISRVWSDVTVEEANLRVHVAALRKVLGDGLYGARYVVNVPGRGYCFVAPVTRSTAERSLPPVETTTAHSPRNLPARLTRMVGRDHIVRTLSSQLMVSRFASIVGPGGIGKTTVAVSVAHTLAEAFNGAVFFIDFAPLTDPQLVPTAVASALGLMVQTQDPLVWLAALIGDRKILLVLDNCEHVIDVAAPLAERLVGEAPYAHVLATSREALRVEGEHVHLLYALDYPPEDAGLTAAEALKYPAAQLFMERAAASGYGAELTDTEALIVARICRRLDGIPLAIELAASGVGSHGIHGTAELLNNRFGLLWQGRRTALRRHQTLDAMLDWSYCLLAEQEKVVLRRLSVLVGEFTLDAAILVACETEADPADVFTAVAILVERSLISTTIVEGSTHYRLLDMTRSYALKKLEESGERDRLARRHAVYFRKLVAPPVLEFGSRMSNEELTRHSRQIDNVRAALDWCFSPNGDETIGIDLTAFYAPVWMALSLVTECCQRCECALLRAEPNPEASSWSKMWLRIVLGRTLVTAMAPSERAVTVLSEALAIADALNDVDAQTQALSALRNVYVHRGEYGQAWIAAERLQQLAHRIGDPAITIVADVALGILLLTLGKLGEAQQCLEHVLRSPSVPDDQRRLNWHHSEHRAMVRARLARALWLQGFADKAHAEAQASLEELHGTHHQRSLCRVLYYGICRITPMTGDFGVADQAISRMVDIATRLNAPFWMTAGRFLEGKLMIARCEFAQGVVILRDAFETCRRTGWQMSYPEFKGAYAEALAGLGQIDDALTAVNDAIVSTGQRENGQRWYLSELLRIKGEVLLQENSDRSISTAEECFDQAGKLAREQGALFWKLRIALSVGRLRVTQGRHHEARQMLVSVCAKFTEGFETADLKAAKALLHEPCQTPAGGR
jgi:predicted ATPase/DNA-binding winged helix-turn-helix (wHTH) protein